MDKERQKIRIALELGWNGIHEELEPVLQFYRTVGTPTDNGIEMVIPDYTEDLNACMALVDHLADKGWGV